MTKIICQQKYSDCVVKKFCLLLIATLWGYGQVRGEVKREKGEPISLGFPPAVMPPVPCLNEKKKNIYDGILKDSVLPILI